MVNVLLVVFSELFFHTMITTMFTPTFVQMQLRPEPSDQTLRAGSITQFRYMPRVLKFTAPSSMTNLSDPKARQARTWSQMSWARGKLGWASLATARCALLMAFVVASASRKGLQKSTYRNTKSSDCSLEGPLILAIARELISWNEGRRPFWMMHWLLFMLRMFTRRLARCVLTPRRKINSFLQICLITGLCLSIPASCWCFDLYRLCIVVLSFAKCGLKNLRAPCR